MAASVFIDGEAGTTGLKIRERLAARSDINLLVVNPDQRKDPVARSILLNAADIVILCLPDEAAREAVALIRRPQVRVIDASSAHRTEPDWTFGFPEMAPGQAQAIGSAKRVANPGCYATGGIALLRPLVDAGVVPPDWPISLNAISGYSGGGKAMIAEFERSQTSGDPPPVRLYGLALGHKHAPEIQRHAGLNGPPIFSPAVGRFAQGMLVELPLPLWALPGAPALAEVHARLAAHYDGCAFVEVAEPQEASALSTLGPEGLNGTNKMKLFVFGDASKGQARLVALLDNLGKGASGAAVQNLNLMLGLPEATGL
jgi:N-acetyl-gamma-glutamyl-phosphate reductase